MGYDSASWDGQIPQGAPAAPASPFFETPIPRSIAAGKIPAATENNPFLASLAPWCSWVFIQDAGGAGGINIHPGIGGGETVVAGPGQIVWIGNGRCGVDYTGAAPTSPVRLIGCTAEQAGVYASQGLSSTIVRATTTANATSVENPVLNGSEQSLAEIPAGVLYAVLSANASTTSPVTLNFGGGSTDIGGSSINSNVTVYGADTLAALTFSGANGQTFDVIYYYRA